MSGARIWLEVGKTEDCMAEAVCKEQGCGWRKGRQRIVWWTQCIRSQDVAGGKGDRGLYDGRNVSGARMGLEVGATEDSMVEAMYKKPGYGWR